MARILFVEYHRSFREAASLRLDQSPDLQVVGQAGTVVEGRRKMAEGGIDIALVNIPLPDEGAVDLVREMYEANPSVPVLVLTTIEDRKIQEEFLAAGASEVLPKDITVEKIVSAVVRLTGEEQENEGIRILVSYEESHLAYRDVIADVIQNLRPRNDVRTVHLRALLDEIERLDPHLVICSRPENGNTGRRAAWITLAPEPGDPSEVCINGRRQPLENPGFDKLLAIVDETEHLIRAGIPPAAVSQRPRPDSA
jgi:DNA-binding response OmpR family regulator